MSLATEIRNDHPQMPIILISGFELDPAKFPAAVHSFLKKPLVRNTLRTALAAAYGSKGQPASTPPQSDAAEIEAADTDLLAHVENGGLILLNREGREPAAR